MENVTALCGSEYSTAGSRVTLFIHGTSEPGLVAVHPRRFLCRWVRRGPLESEFGVKTSRDGYVTKRIMPKRVGTWKLGFRVSVGLQANRRRSVLSPAPSALKKLPRHSACGRSSYPGPAREATGILISQVQRLFPICVRCKKPEFQFGSLKGF